MTSICAKCVHQGYFGSQDDCYAPGWSRRMDFVTGKLTPAAMSCKAKNSTGQCQCFKPKLLRRMWNALLSLIIAP